MKRLFLRATLMVGVVALIVAMSAPQAQAHRYYRSYYRPYHCGHAYSAYRVHTPYYGVYRTPYYRAYRTPYYGAYRAHVYRPGVSVHVGTPYYSHYGFYGW